MKFQESFARNNLKYFPALNVFYLMIANYKGQCFFRHTLIDLIIAIGAKKISFIGQEEKNGKSTCKKLREKNMAK